MKMMRKMMKTMKTMRKKDDSYLCLAAWAEGKPGYRRVPFLSLQLSSLSSPLFSPLSSLPLQLSSLHHNCHYCHHDRHHCYQICHTKILHLIIISTIVTDQNCHHNWHHITVNGFMIIFYINDINIFIQILTVIVLRCEYSWKTSLLSLRNSTGSFFVLKISTLSTRGLNTCPANIEKLDKFKSNARWRIWNNTNVIQYILHSLLVTMILTGSELSFSHIWPFFLWERSNIVRTNIDTRRSPQYSGMLFQDKTQASRTFFVLANLWQQLRETFETTTFRYMWDSFWGCGGEVLNTAVTRNGLAKMLEPYLLVSSRFKQCLADSPL